MSEPRSIFPIDAAKEDERLYFEMIDRALENKQRESISNGKPSHAVYLLHKFLSSAKNSLKICTGRLSQEFDGFLAFADPVLVNSAAQFLMRENTSLSIIIVGDPDIPEGQKVHEHPLLKGLPSSQIKGSVKVFKGNPKDWDNFDYHFIVMDDEAVRVEYDTEKAKAFVNFGDADLGQKLGELFDLFEQRSRVLFQLPKSVAS